MIVSEVNDSSFGFPEYPEKFDDHLFSERFSCPECNISLPELEPRNFSFNTPHGACPECNGIGTTLNIDPKLIIGGCYTSHNISEYGRRSSNQSFLDYVRSLDNYESTINDSGNGVLISYKRAESK